MRFSLPLEHPKTKWVDSHPAHPSPSPLTGIGSYQYMGEHTVNTRIFLTLTIMFRYLWRTKKRLGGQMPTQTTHLLHP